MTIEYRLPQQRSLRTTLPGPPRSAELTERRRNVVGAGVGSSVPVYVADADGGVIVDVDGNSLIDLGSGIAVTSVGASDSAVVEAVREQAGRFTHTCFMVTPVRGVHRGRRTARRPDAGRPSQAHGVVQQRRRGGGERGEDRPQRHRP